MGFRIIWPHDQSISSASVVRSGAKFYAYQNETTTPVTLYSDRDCTATRANPVVALSDGRFPIVYIAADNLLTLALNTSADVEIDSWDDFKPEANTDDLLLADFSNIDDPPTARDALGLGDFALLDKDTLSEDTAPAGASDFLVHFDVSANQIKKVKHINVRPTEALIIPVGDESTVITTGSAKLTFRMPYAFTVTAVRSSVKTASSSGLVTIDINESGASILSTALSIDANEKTSTTAATPAVISDASLADDAEITIDIDAAGTGAVGLKCVILGYRA